MDPRLRRATIVAVLLGINATGWIRDPATSVVPGLIGIAALCVIGLTHRTTPTIAWLGAILAGYSFATLPIAAARGADPRILEVSGWLGLAAPAGFAALASMWIATEFATRPERPVAPLVGSLSRVLLGWLAVAIVVTWVAAATGQRSDPAFTWVDVATYPIAWYVPFVAFVTAIGLAAELRWAWVRAAERTARERGTARAWAVAAATVDELVPGRGAAAQASVVAERRQLAGDLHASVVPSLRRAIDEAEAGADPRAVLRHLRSADLELERLMADRWPIVLETFGLVAALEDLAERLEAGGGPPIGIEIERADGRPPREVEGAAWRFAQLALDNAVRHAGAGSIDVRVVAGPETVRLTIADDGRGFDPSSERRPGARGLADIAVVAAAVGATSRVDARVGGGTTTTFGWPPD